jgi:gliding motility-associated-like protein
MRFTFLLLSLLICFNNYSQDFQWVGQINGLLDENETAEFIEVDNNGNTYTLGKSNSNQFDINPTQNGVQIVNNQNLLVANPEDIYLIKLNENGDFIWGKTLSVLKYDDNVLGLKLDSQGNIYVLAFITELYLNQTIVYGYGFLNVIKIDTNGNEIYRHKFQNIGNINTGKLNANASFEIDNYGDIYISGSFQNTVILDSNPQNNLVANGNSSYLFKLNQNGQILWTKNLNFIVSGKFILEIDSNHELNLLVNCFDNSNTYILLKIIKLNNFNGNQIWTKSIVNAHLSDFCFDTNDNYAIVGAASNNYLIDLNPDLTQSNNIQDMSFILFLDSNGNYLDSKFFDLNIVFNAIEIDNYNNYHLGGYFANGNYDFDPSNNSYFLTSVGYYFDACYLKLDSNRNFSNAFTLGSSPSTNGTCYYNRINSLKILNENIFIAGDFGGNCDLDPSPTSSFLLNSFNYNVINLDGFILKLGNCDTTTPLGNSSQTFCSSQNPTISDLSPNSGIIKWYSSQTSVAQLQSTDNLVNGQTYYAAKQVGSCPESTDRLPVTVSIVQSSLAPIVSNQDFCENENATLNSLNVTGLNLTWYDSNNNILPNNTILINNETYYVSQKINNCESNKTSFTAIVNSNVSPTLTSPQQFCIQQNATLNNITISGQNIKWYDASTGGNLLPNTTLLQNGITYYASQTINGCESTRVPVLVNIQNTPAPTGNQNQSFCSTENATLNNVAVTGTDIIWYNSLSGNTVLPTSTLLQNGVTYYASQTINGCESSTRLAVSIQLINTLNANNYSETLCDDLNNGIETVNLSNYNSFIISSTGNTIKYYYSLNGAQNQLTSDEVQNSSYYNLSLGNNLFYVRIESPNTCFQIVTLNLTLVSKPFININDIMPICEGSSITVDAGFGYDNYNWSTNETSSYIIISQPGNYSVTVSENHGALICSSTKNFTVVNSNIGTISEIITADWTQNENTISVLLTSNSAGNYEYSLNGIDFQDNNTFYGLENGEYTVYVRDKNGCGVSSEEVYLLMYPKYFTPNGDSSNDHWRIKFSENEPNLIVTIFDRYGKLMTQFDSSAIGWDGTYQGYEMPSSDYWFVVKRENGKEFKGHFSLKR